MAREGAALITGAGRRLGLAIARALADDGRPVALACNNSLETAEAAAEDIRRNGGMACAIHGDLADCEMPERIVNEAAGKLGTLTLLVNNAAVFIDDSVRTVSLDSIGANIGVNLIAPILLTQAFAEQLPESATGNVINLLDQRIANPTPRYMSYTASKVALETMTRIWALELAPAVRVNAIAPGMALPNHNREAEDMAHWTSGYPLGRGTSPDEVCEALRFFVSVPSLTGQVLYLDGGQRLGWRHPVGGYPLGPDIA